MRGANADMGRRDFFEIGFSFVLDNIPSNEYSRRFLREEFNVDKFTEFLSGRGIDDVEELESFLNEFITDPALFFNLTVKERTDLESKMDAAFSLLEKV